MGSPAFGYDNIFGQVQPSDLAKMLQAAFPPAPALDYMPLPDTQQQEQAPIQLSGVSVKPNAWGALGSGLQGASQIAGAAFAAKNPNKTDFNPIFENQSGGFNPDAANVKPMDIPITRTPMLPTQDLSGLQYDPLAKNPFGE